MYIKHNVVPSAHDISTSGHIIHMYISFILQAYNFPDDELLNLLAVSGQ